MSSAPSESFITKTFSFHLSPFHPQFHHPRSLPFGNALYTHPVLLTLVLWGCNPAGNFQRWFHWALLNASFQRKGVAGLCTKGRQWGLLSTLSTWGAEAASLQYCLTPGKTLCYILFQFLRWHNDKGPLQLLLALVFNIPNPILVLKKNRYLQSLHCCFIYSLCG